MDWRNLFKSKIADDAEPTAGAPAAEAPSGTAIVWPPSTAACEEIKRLVHQKVRAAELRASERSTLGMLSAGEDVRNRAIAELTKLENREAAALAELIRSVTHSAPLEIKHNDGDTYTATLKAAKGSGFECGTGQQAIYDKLGAEIAANTSDVVEFITSHLAISGSVQTINRTKNIATSTMVGGKMNRTIFTDIIFIIDRDKLNSYSEKIAATQLNQAIVSLDATDFEVRPRGKDRKFAIDIRGNDPTIRRKITEKLEELGVPHNSELHFGRANEHGPLPFDAAQGDIRYIRILMPEKFGEQIDMLKDLATLNIEIDKRQDLSGLNRRIGTDSDMPPTSR